MRRVVTVHDASVGQGMVDKAIKGIVGVADNRVTRIDFPNGAAKAIIKVLMFAKHPVLAVETLYNVRLLEEVQIGHCFALSERAVLRFTPTGLNRQIARLRRADRVVLRMVLNLVRADFTAALAPVVIEIAGTKRELLAFKPVMVGFFKQLAKRIVARLVAHPECLLLEAIFGVGIMTLLEYNAIQPVDQRTRVDAFDVNGSLPSLLAIHAYQVVLVKARSHVLRVVG
ncbi:hypothetical protein D3C76_1094030 [compost metagenome]